MKTANECKNLGDIRTEIDRIDRQLVSLMAERQTYIDAAARVKTGPEQIIDRARIEEVINHVCEAGERAGLSPAIAEPVWRTLIEQSIAREYALMGQPPEGE